MSQDPFERLRDHRQVAVLSLAADGVVTGWSMSAERMLGYSSDQVLGRAFSALVQDPAAVERALVELEQHRPSTTACLTAPLRSHDPQAPAFLCVDILRDPAGQVQGFVVTVREWRAVIFEAGAERLAVPDPRALQGLTPRQRTVLEMIARGYSTREIAKRLDRSVKTIETHRAQLMKRLNVYHVPGLVGFAIRAGLVTLD